MFAVLEIAGKQFMVEKGKTIIVDQLSADEGSEMELGNVVLFNKDGKDAVSVGAPFVDGVKIKVKVLNHQRGEKIRVFKMKSKKRQRRAFGHRSYQTRLQIVDIVA
ncbi:MAG: 50S ribosomal protein L21 [Candidatus Gracilibacteria bacterium]